MKSFFTRYSYVMVKLFLNQFALALFGLGLWTACSRTQNKVLMYSVCAFSVLFYLFLQYAVMWEVGAKDGISAVAKKQSRGLWRGFAIVALANSLNFLMAIVSIFRDFAVAGSMLSQAGALFRTAAMLLQGTYLGLLSMPFGGLALRDFAWVYFVLPLPAILVGGISYVLGSYNLHATNILIPKNKDVKNNGRPE